LPELVVTLFERLVKMRLKGGKHFPIWSVTGSVAGATDVGNSRELQMDYGRFLRSTLFRKPFQS